VNRGVYGYYSTRSVSFSAWILRKKDNHV